MKVRLTKPCDTIDGPKPVGFVIDRPDAHWLLRLGVAEPVPDEPPPAAAVTEAKPLPVGTLDVAPPKPAPAAIAADAVIK